jgi:hypothetical protein
MKQRPRDYSCSDSQVTSCFCWNNINITVFITTCNWALPWASWIHSTLTHTTSCTSNLIGLLHSHPSLALLSGHFLFGFSTSIFTHVSLPLEMLHEQPISFHLSDNKEQAFKLRRSTLYNFLQLRVSSFVSDAILDPACRYQEPGLWSYWMIGNYAHRTSVQLRRR